MDRPSITANPCHLQIRFFNKNSESFKITTSLIYHTCYTSCSNIDNLKPVLQIPQNKETKKWNHTEHTKGSPTTGDNTADLEIPNTMKSSSILLQKSL